MNNQAKASEATPKNTNTNQLNSQPVPRRLLLLSAVKDRTGLSKSAIYRAMALGEFPRPVKVAQSSVRWVESEVDAWIVARIAERGAA